MPIRIAHKYLHGTVGTAHWTTNDDTQRLQVLAPRLEVFHPERKMIPARLSGARGDRHATDEVQFLDGAQPKPRPREVKGRTRHRCEPEDSLVKITTPFH